MLPSMPEPMSYGLHIVLDGFQASAEAMSKEVVGKEILEGIGRIIEPEAVSDTRLFSFYDSLCPGNSGATLLPESNVTLHFFPDTHKLTLKAFSRHQFRIGEIITLLSLHLGVGRFETVRRNHSRPTPRDQTILKRVLQGDRLYAHLRLEDLLKEGAPQGFGNA